MKKSKDNIIYLEDFRVEGAKVFTGRDRGASVRKKSNIDNIEEKYDEVTIVIPDNIYSINPSFFEEFFVNVVEKLGKDRFHQKFKFKNDGEYNYKKRLDEAIDSILLNTTALH